MATDHNAAPSNRERIIVAAYRVLAEQGYEATTIKAIAREAGVAPGLIHYYFANKEELLAAVLQAESEQFTRDQQQLTSRLSDQSPVVAALSGPLSRAREHPERYQLRYELFALSLHHGDIRQKVEQLLAHGRQGIAASTQLVTQGAITGPEADMLGAILITTFDGLALQSLINPDFDLDGAYQLLAKILEAYFQQRIR